LDNDEKILRSLMRLKEARFDELLRETQTKTGSISRQTFATRLANLEKDGVVKHEKRKYSLGASKLRVRYDEKSRLRLIKVEKMIQKLPYSRNMFTRAYDLLIYLFSFWYFPLIFEHVCKPDKFSSYDKLQYKIRRKKCEELIQEIYFIVKKEEGNHKANDVIEFVKLAYERIPSKTQMS